MCSTRWEIWVDVFPLVVCSTLREENGRGIYHSVQQHWEMQVREQFHVEGRDMVNEYCPWCHYTHWNMDSFVLLLCFICTCYSLAPFLLKKIAHFLLPVAERALLLPRLIDRRSWVHFSLRALSDTRSLCRTWAPRPWMTSSSTLTVGEWKCQATTSSNFSQQLIGFRYLLNLLNWNLNFWTFWTEI